MEAEGLLLDLLYGRWRSQTLHAGVELGIFDCVGPDGLDAPEIARRLALDPALCYRLLRALRSLHLLREDDGHRFALTPAGERLQRAHPQSMRDVVLLREGREHTAIWKHLPDIVRDGVQDGFVREYGATPFAYAHANPDYGNAFDAGMSSHSRLHAAWTIDALRDCELESVGHLCDVGGGQGYLLCQLLQRYPHLTGTVLERADVLADPQALWATRLALSTRCRYLAGDMFVSVPPADAYMLKMILHDWNDDECVAILRGLHARGNPECRVFIVEHVIPQSGEPDMAALFDMHMMCWGTGRERTVDEYQALLDRSGWRLAATRYPNSGAIGVIEATRAR